MRRAMWLSVMPLVGIVLGACAAPMAAKPPAVPAVEPPETKEIADIKAELVKAREKFGAAYRARDAAALAALFAEDAHWAGTEHPFWMESRQAIQANWTRFFQRYPTAEIYFWRVTTRVYNPKIHTGYFTMWMPDRTGQMRIIHGRFSTVWHKFGEEWKIVLMHISQLPETR